jgi:hypothetical protein
MIKLLVAHTFEIDNPRIAADEIVKGLDLEHSLLKNSVGLVFCSWDFIMSGAARTVCEALPFDVIGCSTYGLAVPGAMSEIMLAAAVLTSDDSFFRAGVSDPLDSAGIVEKRIGGLYGRLAESLQSPPSLIFMCHPNSVSFRGGWTVNILNRVSGGLPVFGTHALAETFEKHLPLVMHNGAIYSDRLALILVCGGAAESLFRVEPLSAMNIYSRPALVTDARDNLLISINDIPAGEFMQQIGIISREKIDGFYAFPLLVDNHDGTGPRTCAIYRMEEDGILRCGETFTRGATLQIVNQVRENVLQSSERIAESMKKESSGKSHLIFSCFGRGAPLVDLKDEMRLFDKHLGENPYVFIYSGGEFCPIYNERGEIRNSFHQFSIVSASF